MKLFFGLLVGLMAQEIFEEIEEEVFEDEMFISKEIAREFESYGVNTSEWNIIEDESQAINEDGSLVEDDDFMVRALYKSSYKWLPKIEGGFVSVPFTVHSSLNAEQDKIIQSMKSLETALGCFYMPFLENVSVETTEEFRHGIIFVKHTGCSSAVGKSKGWGIAGLGVPAGWQKINLTTGCAQSTGVTQHEVLHALGVLHEQQRPDRDEYIDYFPERTSNPGAWSKVSSERWFDTSDIYDPVSIMQYSSFTFANSDQPIATFKDGSHLTRRNKITTTDALQIQKMYCQRLTKPFSDGEPMFPDYELSDTATCTSEDKIGEKRRVFTDRLCDGTQDCPGGEDEDGSLAMCNEKYPRTPNGCCGGIFLCRSKCYTCIYNPDSVTSGRETWSCPDGSGIISLWTSWWYHMTPSYYPFPGGSYSYWDKVNGGANICPPMNIQMNRLGTRLSCAKDGPALPDNCASNDCDENATCTSKFEGYSCKCNEGYKGDGNSCTFIPEVDECALGTHTCGPNADCTDIRDGFKCSCKDGYVNNNEEVGRSWPASWADPNGNDCVVKHECCQKLKLGWRICHRTGPEDKTAYYTCEGIENVIRYAYGSWRLYKYSTGGTYYTAYNFAGYAYFCFRTESLYGNYECLDESWKTTKTKSSTTTTTTTTTSTTTSTTTTTTTQAPEICPISSIPSSLKSSTGALTWACTNVKKRTRSCKAKCAGNFIDRNYLIRCLHRGKTNSWRVVKGSAPTCELPDHCLTSKCDSSCIPEKHKPEGEHSWQCQGNKCRLVCKNGNDAGGYGVICRKKQNIWIKAKGTKLPSCTGDSVSVTIEKCTQDLIPSKFLPTGHKLECGGSVRRKWCIVKCESDAHLTQNKFAVKCNTQWKSQWLKMDKSMSVITC